tara:strand:- start:608 stop:838 length:231 start_codon:yes stop_codon:yes gene_type:complete
MKKILTMSVVIMLLSFTSSKSSNNFKIDEVINTLEDMKEWMLYDIETNDIDKEKGLIYIENIDVATERLKTLNPIK